MNPLQLLEKYFPDKTAFRIIHEHSRNVATKALAVGNTMGLAPDRLAFIEEAAILHDIGVCSTASPKLNCFGSEPYIRHGIIGRNILEEEGLPLHAMVCERHIGVGLTSDDIVIQGLPLPERDMSPTSLEEEIVCYADLFYSKKPGELNLEKSADEVRKSLSRFGIQKVALFNKWQERFDCYRS
jgi:uncharacterized protein